VPLVPLLPLLPLLPLVPLLAALARQPAVEQDPDAARLVARALAYFEAPSNISQ
jgi:hypothetical protein